MIGLFSKMILLLVIAQGTDVAPASPGRGAPANSREQPGAPAVLRAEPTPATSADVFPHFLSVRKESAETDRQLSKSSPLYFWRPSGAGGDVPWHGHDWCDWHGGCGSRWWCWTSLKCLYHLGTGTGELFPQKFVFTFPNVDRCCDFDCV